MRRDGSFTSPSPGLGVPCSIAPPAAHGEPRPRRFWGPTGSVSAKLQVQRAVLKKGRQIGFSDREYHHLPGRGYVLDFSDPSFTEFFETELDVDIDDPIYSQSGGSKGKRLGSFLQKVDAAAVRALKALWEHRAEFLADPTTRSSAQCRGPLPHSDRST